MIKKSIAHITTVHSRYDTRIFIKECVSLANAGFDVSLVVADGGRNEEKEGVKIYGVYKAGSMVGRMIKSTRAVYNKTLEIDADVCHIHDPELLFFGLRLLKKGKKVIFDAHEDFPKQLKSKPYLNKFMRISLAIIAEKVELYAFKKFTMLIGATPSITNKLHSINNNSACINNYPILGELDNEVEWSFKKKEVCYIGAISRIRGIVQLVKAMEYVEDDVKLNLVGNFAENDLFEELKMELGWKKVNYLGSLSRKEVSKVLGKSKVGMVTFLNAPNHTESQPNKMFEYMSSGIPIIGSNFPLWKEILEKHECGLTVNPENPKAIANKIMQLVGNDFLSEVMGQNGKKMIMNMFNWSVESDKLVKVYKEI